MGLFQISSTYNFLHLLETFETKHWSQLKSEREGESFFTVIISVQLIVPE